MEFCGIRFWTNSQNFGFCLRLKLALEWKTGSRQLWRCSEISDRKSCSWQNREIVTHQQHQILMLRSVAVGSDGSEASYLEFQQHFDWEEWLLRPLVVIFIGLRKSRKGQVLLSGCRIAWIRSRNQNNVSWFLVSLEPQGDSHRVWKDLMSNHGHRCWLTSMTFGNLWVRLFLGINCYPRVDVQR